LLGPLPQVAAAESRAREAEARAKDAEKAATDKDALIKYVEEEVDRVKSERTAKLAYFSVYDRCVLGVERGRTVWLHAARPTQIV
jgi:hypothetical protein